MTGLELTKRLKEAAWVDGYTEIVQLEFTLYNPAVNLFTTVVYAFEFADFAGTSIIQSDYFSSYQVYSFTANTAILLLICQIIYIIHIIRCIYRFVQKLRLIGFKNWYQQGFWNYVDLLIIIVDLCAVAFFVGREVTARSTLEQFHEDEGRRFVNFGYNALMSNYLICCLAFGCFFSVIQVLKLLRFNQKVGLLALILRTAGKSMGGMTLAFGIAMLAHAWILHMLFAQHFVNYRSYLATLFNLFTFMLGDDQYDHISNVNANLTADYLGKLAFLTFSIIMILFILNFVISVIDAAMSVSQEQNIIVNGEDYELARFMQNKVASMFEGATKLPPKYRAIMKEKRLKKLKNLEAIGPQLEKAVDELDARVNLLLELELEALEKGSN